MIARATAIQADHEGRPYMSDVVELDIDAAIDADGLGGHVVAFGDDVAHTGGYFFWSAEAGHRNFFEDTLTDVFGNIPEHVGFSETGADGVDGDAMTCYFQRDRLGKTYNASFCGGVVGLSDIAGQGDKRADVDDFAAFTCQHVC